MKHILLAVLLVVALPGCDFFSKSHPKMAEVWPVYQAPSKPNLKVPGVIVPGANPDLDMTVKSLYDTIQYAESLRIILESHNQAAKAHNRTVETGLGIGK